MALCGDAGCCGTQFTFQVNCGGWKQKTHFFCLKNVLLKEMGVVGCMMTSAGIPWHKRHPGVVPSSAGPPYFMGHCSSLPDYHLSKAVSPSRCFSPCLLCSILQPAFPLASSNLLFVSRLMCAPPACWRGRLWGRACLRRSRGCDGFPGAEHPRARGSGVQHLAEQRGKGKI